MTSLEDLLRFKGEHFDIYRNGELVDSNKGLRKHQAGRDFIAFMPEVDIRREDELAQQGSADKYRVVEVRTDDAEGSVQQIRVYWSGQSSKQA
ncbi:MAG: hypothetical protein ACJ8FY_18580 [Gemmataceae bacterium]